MVGVCTGTADADTDLVSEIVMQENMVIIPAGLQPFTYYVGESLEVITIESRSGAWGSIEEGMVVMPLHAQKPKEWKALKPDWA